NRLLLLRLDLQRSQIHDFFVRRVRNALIREGDGAEHDQDDPEHCEWAHAEVLPPEIRATQVPAVVTLTPAGRLADHDRTRAHRAEAVEMRRLIKIYDTTLRDGTQGEGISFSMEDKVRLATRLDALGIHYIEGGWPGSNPKDLRFFRRMQDVA